MAFRRRASPWLSASIAQSSITPYAEELRMGAAKANARVAESLFRKAAGDGPQSVATSAPAPSAHAGVARYHELRLGENKIEDSATRRPDFTSLRATSAAHGEGSGLTMAAPVVRLLGGDGHPVDCRLTGRRQNVRRRR